VSGPIGLEPPFAADLAVVADDLRIVDPLLYETTLDGRLAITGPLAGGGGRIAGTLALAETEVRIPSSGLGGSGAIPVIEHRNAPLAVQVTRERARLADAPPVTRRGTPQNNAFALDLTILAENRIFVRGRGLDAELGGALRLTGTTADVIPAGQFDLIRGRLDLLGQRFEFDEGSFALQGDFVPVIRLVAVTETDDDQISIILEGDLTDPELSIVSGAGLPEDEAIARLLFGRDLTQLSPLQAARLAAAVAELSGRGSGLTGGLREGLGLDDLDITTAEDGSVGVRAGAYLTENIYTDLSVDEQGRTEINLNLDVTDEVTVTGRAGAEGDSGIGVFFQRDY
jgi:translocation and assembly module TamB